MPTKPSVPTQIASRIMQSALNHGVYGVGPLAGAVDLASRYHGATHASGGADAAVTALTRHETAKGFAMGFATGLGGVAMLPVALPIGLWAGFVIQARAVAAIAALYGHSVRDERVRALILVCLLGDGFKEVGRQAGIRMANRAAASAVARIPGRALAGINRRIGVRLLTRAGGRGFVSLTRLVPLVGGVLGGVVDAWACRAACRVAVQVFRPGSPWLDIVEDAKESR